MGKSSKNCDYKNELQLANLKKIKIISSLIK